MHLNRHMMRGPKHDQLQQQTSPQRIAYVSGVCIATIVLLFSLSEFRSVTPNERKPTLVLRAKPVKQNQQSQANPVPQQQHPSGTVSVAADHQPAEVAEGKPRSSADTANPDAGQSGPHQPGTAVKLSKPTEGAAKEAAKEAIEQSSANTPVSSGEQLGQQTQPQQQPVSADAEQKPAGAESKQATEQAAKSLGGNKNKASQLPVSKQVRKYHIVSTAGKGVYAQWPFRVQYYW